MAENVTRGQLMEMAGGIGPVASKTVTFTGAAGLGAQGTVNLFTVTGLVQVRIFAVCTTNLAGATATLAVGTALTTGGLIAQTTATDIDANEIWHDATPDAGVELATVSAEKLVSQNIIGTVGTADITGGVIEFYCIWKPISSDGNVEAA